jgi:serine/threonine-protein kinase
MTELTRLGKYELRRELGKGAMGIVYEGFDPVIERTVAIKTIRPEQLDKAQAADILARFKREAQAAGRLNHPNIVAIYDYGEVVPESASPASQAGSSRVAFIAMEFIKGRELRDYFDANERFGLKEIERIMGELLDALDHAHRNGVTHRDMKPANIILLPDGRVKVADFGIARIETSQLTQAGTILGTPAYMSPEQFLGQPVDGRSDIFSCGVILYQFLTGEKPFTGTVTTIMHKVLKEEPLPPSTLNVTLPAAWDIVVRTAMAKNPAQRYQSAAEFGAAIKAVVASRSTDPTVVNLDVQQEVEATVVSQTTPAGPVNAPAAATPAAATVPPPAAAKPRPNMGTVAWVTVAVLLALGAGGYLLRDRERTPATPVAQNAPPAAPAPAASPAPTPAVAPVAADPAPEPGTMIISALGLVNPSDPRFNGDQAAAQAEARADAKRQLVEKAAALYVEQRSLDKNYGVIEQKLLAQPGAFIKTVLQESAPQAGKDGLIATETRAAVKVRDVQKSLNQMSREERIDFIRNNGDPRIAIVMTIRNADTAQPLPSTRSQLAENVVKERIKSFGFRVWTADGETRPNPDAKRADFQIHGEVKVKQLSARLAASGITITKTALTSWTVKAVDQSSGEEIYLNTILPKGKSWAGEDQALVEIGKMVGDEFSRNFFLQHFNFTAQPINLILTGLPDAQSARLLLRELRGIREVLDAQLVAESGRFRLQLREGSAMDIVQEAILKPLNAKLGQNCFAPAGSNGSDVNISFASACAEPSVRARLETLPPAGLLNAPESRGKALLKGAAKNLT